MLRPKALKYGISFSIGKYLQESVHSDKEDLNCRIDGIFDSARIRPPPKGGYFTRRSFHDVAAQVAYGLMNRVVVRHKKEAIEI